MDVCCYELNVRSVCKSLICKGGKGSVVFGGGREKGEGGGKKVCFSTVRMGDGVGGDGLPEEVTSVLDTFEGMVRGLEKTVKPVVELVRDEKAMEEVGALDCARVNITLAYAANSLFYMCVGV